MNKVLKGLVAVAATAAMAVAGFAGASTAMAVDGNTVNVTVPGADSNLNGHAYTAYQILFGTQATSGGALGDAAWGSGINGVAFLKALQADTTIGKYFANVTDAKGFAEALSNIDNFPADGANTRLVAKIAMKNKQGNGTALAAGNSTQLDKGYYLIVDSTATGQTVYNPAVLAITSDIEIKDKTDVPTLEKKVQENKKSMTGEYGNGFNDVADYNIGDDVPFHLIGSVPDMSQYETYTYKFTDTFDKGFDAVNTNNVKVYLSNDKKLDLEGESADTDITSYFSGTNGSIQYTAATEAQGEVAGTRATLTVSTKDLKKTATYSKSQPQYVIVSYTAKLNAKAEIGLPGNVNEVKGLKFRSSLAYKYYMNDVTTFNPKNNVRYDAEGNALTTVGTNKLTDYHYLETTYINENILTYDFSVGKHSFNLLAGHSIQATRWDKNEASKQGFATDNIYEMDGGTMNDHVTGSAEESSLQSFFGRLNYNYGGRYLLEMNVRHDGSSRMPKAHRYATFPSFSGAWIMTNEKFMENVKFLHSLKLRGSWGKLGNQEIGNYAYAATLAASGSYYFGDSKQIGMKTAKIPNENIKWETTTITDFGFDAAFWGGKINVTFDWYEKNTSDILMKLAMPGIFLGSLDAPYQNAGKVRNRGWELAANYFDQKGDWAWQAGFSLSGVKNEITDMKGVEDISNNTINREGEAIGSYYGLKAIGIYRTQADLDRVNANGQKILQNNQEPQLGDIMYEDIDNNGNINDADRTVIGNPFPKMQYSFNLGFSYKDFDVNTFLARHCRCISL